MQVDIAEEDLGDLRLVMAPGMGGVVLGILGLKSPDPTIQGLSLAGIVGGAVLSALLCRLWYGYVKGKQDAH